jgi:DNA-directed RNA polymerase subunit K/omega
MEQLKKSDLLKNAKNEYLGAMLAAKVARRLHAMRPEDRPDPSAKVTSLALKLITNGQVEYEINEDEGTEAEDLLE